MLRIDGVSAAQPAILNPSMTLTVRKGFILPLVMSQMTKPKRRMTPTLTPNMIPVVVQVFLILEDS